MPPTHSSPETVRRQAALEAGRRNLDRRTAARKRADSLIMQIILASYENKLPKHLQKK